MTTLELQAIIDDQMVNMDSRESMPRDVLNQIKYLPEFATIIKGIRRCGKSTLAQQWRRQMNGETLALNFDDLRMMPFTLDDFRLLDQVLLKRKPSTIVFDEIQSIRGWELYVRQKLDQGQRILLTGSNASLLSRELGTRLSGRHLDQELHVFSFPEFIRFRGLEPNQTSLREYLRQGGFPGYLKTGDADILKSLVEDILYKDVALRHNLRNVQPLKDLCLFLLGSAAKRISPTRLKEAMRVKSATTILEYVGFLEEAYLVERMEVYSPSTKARLLAPKKIYIADTALSYTLHASMTPDLGHLLENIVYWHLRRMSPELYYFDDGSCECDFLAKRPNGSFSPIQVTWALDESNETREFNGLVHAMKNLGANEGTIVTADRADETIREGFRIRIVPAYDFLRETMP